MSILRLEPAARRLPAPAWALALVALWAGLVVTWQLLPVAGERPPLCLLRRTTGVPCPTCGATRGVLALGRGDVLGALAFNPLVITALLLAAAWLVARIGWGRSVRLDLGPRGRRAAWLVAGVLLLANWAWLIWRES